MWDAAFVFMKFLFLIIFSRSPVVANSNNNHYSAATHCEGDYGPALKARGDAEAPRAWECGCDK